MDTEDAELNELVEKHVRNKQALIEMLKNTKSDVNDLIDVLETSGTDESIDKYYQSIMLSIISMLSSLLAFAANLKKTTIMIQDLNDNES